MSGNDEKNPAEEAEKDARETIEKIKKKGRVDEPGPVAEVFEKQHGKDRDKEK